MAQVGLFKKVGKYTDKQTGKEKPFTNFYLRCGDSLIPVQVVYYENSAKEKETENSVSLSGCSYTPVMVHLQGLEPPPQLNTVKKSKFTTIYCGQNIAFSIWH